MGFHCDYRLIYNSCYYAYYFLLRRTKSNRAYHFFSIYLKPLFAASQGVAFFYGAAFIICTVYIPIFVQGVLGGSASNAGLILTPMMIGSVIGSQTGGQLAPFSMVPLLSSVQFISQSSFKVFSVVQPQMLD